MFPERAQPYLFALTLSCLMSFIISGVSTWRAAGMSAEFPGLWLGAWVFSWAVAFPCVVILAPVARKLVAKLIRS